MSNSKKWIAYFESNAKNQRVGWHCQPSITKYETEQILESLQAWQLGETSDGSHLMRASAIYAARIGEPEYVHAVQLFIKEEQKHGNNLGKYLDLINKPRINKNWGDTLFRKIRYFNSSMEIWTLTVITVESAAQIFYQSLKDATGCPLLKQVCTDILIDEAYHIDFQLERLMLLFEHKPQWKKVITAKIYRVFFYSTSLVIWMAHKKVFKAGGNNFSKYSFKMGCKYRKTLRRLMNSNFALPVYGVREAVQ